MEITVFDILTWTMISLNPLIVAKVVTLNKPLQLKECLYILIASLVSAILSVINISIINIGISTNVFTIPLSCMIYFHKIKSYSIRKTFALLFIPIMVVIFIDIIVMTFMNTYFPAFMYDIPNFPLMTGLSYNNFLQYVPYALSSIILAAAAAYLCLIITKKQCKLISQNEKAQMILATISLIIIVIAIIIANTWHYRGSEIEDLAMNTLPMFSIAAATLVCVVFYTVSLHERMIRQQKESEQKAMQQYTEQIEQQQIIVQKFKHDYKNILLSIEGYLEVENITGLKEYFNTQIKTADNAIIQSDFTLHRLNNIKIPEIKATLVNKFMAAESAGIDAKFEINEEIDYIPVNSVVLVRMLSIMLDNAVEALEKLQSGTLSVACYKNEQTVVFIVQNTCPKDLPPLSQLRRTGYSTKGEGRGLGLSNLKELIGVHPNIILQTNIAEGNFIQKISIGKS
ncbi:MAG: GHKL domain-containing protein [Oscillospiraceae bacterium]|nr:GHKL domain-containing protein [Oscillospiraceae bacterium]